MSLSFLKVYCVFLHFTESLYIISSTEQSLFGFSPTNIEDNSKLLRSSFHGFILKRKPNTAKQILFPVSYFNKNPLFTEVIQVTYFSTTFSFMLDGILPFLDTLTTPLCTSKTCHTRTSTISDL